MEQDLPYEAGIALEITTSIYSRDWGLPDEEHFDVPPRDLVFIHLTEICVPLDECITIRLGTLHQSAIAKLDQSGFDQASVPVPNSELGWRLLLICHIT
jgi:hypothetical protein